MFFRKTIGQTMKETIRLATPRAPAGLSASALRFWREIAEGWELDAAGFALLECAVKALETAKKANEILRNEGLIQIGPRGGTKAHPAAAIAARASRDFARFVKDLDLADDHGKTMTPAALWNKNAQLKRRYQ